MSRAMQLAENAKQLATTYRSVLEIADYLQEVGSLEQAADEVKAAYATACTQRDAVLAEIADGTAQVAALTAAVDAKKQEAAQILMAANASADAIVTDAREQAVRIQYEAKIVTDAAEQDAANAHATLADVEQQIAARQATLDTLDALIASTKQSLSSL